MNNKNMKEIISGVFTRAAPTYDQVGFRISEYFGKRLVELIEIQKGFKVLDVGSGRGASIFPSSNKVGSKGSVIGIDLSEGMVQKTTEEIINRGISNAKIMQMDAESLEFQDNTFDIALYGFCIHFFPHYEIALNEAYRIIKPNGRIGLSNPLKGAFDEIKWFDDLFEKYLPKNLENNEMKEELKEPDFNSKNGMQKILVRAGFRDVYNIIDENEFICENVDELWKGLWSQFTRQALESFSQDNLQKFKEELTKEFQRNRSEDGLHWNFKALYTFGRK
ncbi:MAG: class I SAM-dependent methyltransferase [Candidatus Thorarchaeota archaeon]